MKKIVCLGTILLFLSCSKNVETYIPFLEGYWEISQVKKDNKILKEYKISTSVDYFKVNDDRSGFRKKVMPNLDGSFTVTDHEKPFQLIIENNDLLLVYASTKKDTLKETIINASKNTLTISNDDGFTYIYKPFEKLSLDE